MFASFASGAVSVVLGPVLILACANGMSNGTEISSLSPPAVTAPTESPSDDSATIPSTSSEPTSEPDGGSKHDDPTDAGKAEGGGPDGSPSTSPSDSSCKTTAPSNACGLAPQCGCGGNETCDVTNKSNGAVSCVAAGGGPLASLCTSTTQCAKGLTCAYGACRPTCETVGTACTGSGLGPCEQVYDPPGTAIPNAKVCSMTCDVRDPSAVCGSNTCVWDPGAHASDCDSVGTKSMFDACTKYNECKAGLACVAHPIYGFECERWCRVGTSGDCGIFETCKDVYGSDAPTSGTTKLGHCQ